MIKIIVGQSLNRVIGRLNKIPWHVPEDMAHFKNTTMGHIVVMGRKTFESLPKGALPGRMNIVLTRDKNFTADNITVMHSVDEVLNWYKADSTQRDLYVMGGAKVYRQFLPYAEAIDLTSIDVNIANGDATFPQLEEDEWLVVKEEEHRTHTFFYIERIPSQH